MEYTEETLQDLLAVGGKCTIHNLALGHLNNKFNMVYPSPYPYVLLILHNCSNLIIFHLNIYNSL